MDSDRVTSYLDNLNITFTRHEHPPVYTVEEAAQYREGIDGVHCKNLFLEDSKRGDFFLLTAEADTPVRLNAVRKMLKAKKLSFASAEKLLDYLGLEPGSVSPFGLINDESNQVKYLVDKKVWEFDGTVNFHPNINTQTLGLVREDFQKFVEQVGNEFEVIDLSQIE